MRLADLPTPCLVLDRAVLRRNLAAALTAASALGVGLRLDMQAAGCIDVARLGFELARESGLPMPGIAVSTLAAAEYFAAYDVEDMLYAGGITPAKLDRLSRFAGFGTSLLVAADDEGNAATIAGHAAGLRALIRVAVDGTAAGLPVGLDSLLRVAECLGSRAAGLMTRDAPIGCVTGSGLAGLAQALDWLAGSGRAVDLVSAELVPDVSLVPGVTELRWGAAMFADRALTVLASVTGRGPVSLLLDAGAVALGAGSRGVESEGGRLLLDLAGEASFGAVAVSGMWPEQSVVLLDDPARILAGGGERLRVEPHHACLTAAAHDRYFVVDNDDEVVAVWPRVGGW